MKKVCLILLLLFPLTSFADLNTNLVSYWGMEEESGTRADSVGSNSLTDNNTVLFSTGIIGNGADFESSNSEYFSITDGSQSGLDFSTDFSFSFWVNYESLPTGGDQMVFFSKRGGGHGYAVKVGASGLFGVNIEGSYDEASSGGGSTGTWYHFVVEYDKASGLVDIYRNGSYVSTISGLDTTLQDSTANFIIADDGAGRYLDGIMDEVGLWNRLLDTDEITSLYNSGAGLAYPFEDIGGGSTSSSTATFTTDITYLDWIVVNMWIIFLLSFTSLGLLFSLWKKH
jgi:hypothetical protein